MAKLENYLIALIVVSVCHFRAASTCVNNFTIEGASNVTVIEGSGYVTVSLKRSGNLQQSDTVRVSSSDASAQSPEDYRALVNKSVPFLANSNSASFNVTIINDNKLEEQNEMFSLRFESNDSSLICDNIASLNVTIRDDDKVTIEFSSTNVTVQEDKKKVSLEIVKTGVAAIPVNVRLNMVKRNFETAEKNVDYTDRHNKTITIAGNEQNKSFEIPIKDDNVAESTEVFAVSLEAVDSLTTIIGNKNMAIVRIEDKADQDFQATTQKQKEDEQEKRFQQLFILLIVCTAVTGVLVAIFIITICLVNKWRKNIYI